MQLIRIVALTASVAAGASIAGSESLGQAAARQKKQREADKSGPEAPPKAKPKTFTEDDLQRYEAERPLSNETPAAAAPMAPPRPASPETPEDWKKRVTAMVREKLAQCRTDLEAARGKLQESEAVNPFMPGTTSTAGAAVQDKQFRVKQARADVERLERNCDIIERDAWKNGIAPSAIQ